MLEDRYKEKLFNGITTRMDEAQNSLLACPIHTLDPLLVVHLLLRFPRQFYVLQMQKIQSSSAWADRGVVHNAGRTLRGRRAGVCNSM